MSASGDIVFNIQNGDIEDERLLLDEDEVVIEAEPDEGENNAAVYIEPAENIQPKQSWSSWFMNGASVVVPTAAVGAFTYGCHFMLEQATVASYLLLSEHDCLNRTTSNTLSEYYSAGYNSIPCPAMSYPWNLPEPIDSISESPVAEMDDPFVAWRITTMVGSMIIGYGVFKYRQHYRQSVAQTELRIKEYNESIEESARQIDADEEECFEQLGDRISANLKDPISMSSYSIDPVLFSPSGNTYSDSSDIRKLIQDPLTRAPITKKLVDHTMPAVTKKAFQSCGKENKDTLSGVAAVQKMKIEYVSLKEKNEFFLSGLYAISPIPPLALAAFSLTTKTVYNYLSQVALPEACNEFLITSNYTYGTSAAYAQGVSDGEAHPHGSWACHDSIRLDPLRNGPHLDRNSSLLLMPGAAAILIFLGATAVVSIPLVLFIRNHINVASLRNALCTNHNAEALQAEAELLVGPQQAVVNYGSMEESSGRNEDIRRRLLLRFAILLCDETEPALWCPVAKKPFILLALAEVIQQEHKRESKRELKREEKSAKVSQIGEWQGLLFCGGGRAFDKNTVLANPAISDGDVCPCDGTQHMPPKEEHKHYTATSFFETLAAELRGNGISAVEVEGALVHERHIAVSMQ